MDCVLHDRIDELIETFRKQLHQQADQVTLGQDGAVLLDLERTLFGLLMALGAALVMAFVEAFHRQTAWVLACQQRAVGKGLRNVGWRSTRLYVLFGGQHTIHTPYARLDRTGRPGRRRGWGKRGKGGAGSYPVLEALGCRANATPALLSEVGSQLGWGPSEEAALSRLSDRGIPLDNQTLRRFFRALSDEALQQRTKALLEGKLPAGLSDESLAGKRVVITFDAGRVRMRHQKPGRRRKNGHHGFDRPWQAPRLLVIYIIDEKGRQKRQELPIYDGVITSSERLFELMKKYLLALQASKADLLIFIADGAPEHWDGVAALVEALGLDPKRVVEIFDWAHATEHLTSAIDACGKLTDPQRTHWLNAQRKRLKKGRLQAVLGALKTLCRGRRASQIRKQINFFEQHAHRMRYPEFRKTGLPIGSGAVESAIRRVVNLRMKGPGIFWTPDNAQRMLFIRCQLLSGRWKGFIRELLCSTTIQTPYPVALAA